MMKKLNVSKETVGKFAKNGCRIVLYGLATILPYISVKDTVDMVRYSGNVGYSDAVGAIMSSGMWSSDKHTVVSMLKKDGDVEYYRAIIQVVKSSMYSADKVETIRNICGK